jgi:hypothetical protein
MYLPSSYLFSYLSTYIWDLFLTGLVTKVKQNINSVEVHPQLSNNRHPVAGAHWCVLVHCGPGPAALVTATLIGIKPQHPLLS